jgi:RNA polymerase sigma factor (sigma-70 family)
MNEENRREESNEQPKSAIEVVLERLLEDQSLEGSADSDRPLWRELYRLQSRRAFAIAFKVGLPRHQIEELNQEVWLKVLPQWESFRQPGGAKNFLALTRKMLHDEAVDMIRKSDHQRAESFESLPVEPKDCAEAEVTEVLDADELRQSVHAKVCELEKLNRQYAWLLREHYWNERPIAEIAVEMGRTPHAVQSLKRRALQALRQRMKKLRQDGEGMP